MSAAVAAILPGLDDDTAAYTISMLAASDGSAEETREMVSGLILSLDLAEDDESAAALVTQLFEQLHITEGDGGAEEPAAPPRLLASKVVS